MEIFFWQNWYFKALSNQFWWKTSKILQSFSNFSSDVLNTRCFGIKRILWKRLVGYFVKVGIAVHFWSSRSFINFRSSNALGDINSNLEYDRCISNRMLKMHSHLPKLILSWRTRSIKASFGKERQVRNWTAMLTSKKEA